MALGGEEPVARDTIFRIASMTKPIVAAAAMVLVEECRLRLDRERILDPLGMGDTAFCVPAGRRHRLPASYMADPTSGLTLYDETGEQSGWSRPPTFPSGGGGLVSTAADFLAVGTMLLHGGARHRDRILSRPSVAAMTTDQLTAEQKPWGDIFGDWWNGHGWGFGMAMATRRDRPWTTPGQFGWDGGLGTARRSDPAEDLVAILMTQRAAFPLLNPVWHDFWTSVYQAIDD